MNLIAQGFKLIDEGIMDLFRETCPNCESAWTGGHPDPESIHWCVLCSHPKTGKMRGWVWRWAWMHRLLVSRHNFAKLGPPKD